MVNSETSGVGFSRHPLKPLSSDVSLIEAVYGLGEGLVSGLLEADRYEVTRYDMIYVKLKVCIWTIHGLCLFCIIIIIIIISSSSIII